KADIEHLFAEAKKSFGKIDVLVNNAGVYDWSPLEEITEEQFHKHFDINVLGLLLATQEAVRQFDSTGGNIINISSTVTSLTPPSSSVYTGTKARSTPSLGRWPRNWGRAKSALTPSIPAWWKRRECAQRASTKAIFAKALKRKLRLAASGSLRTSLPPRSFSLRLIPGGSRAKHCVSLAASVNRQGINTKQKNPEIRSGADAGWLREG